MQKYIGLGKELGKAKRESKAKFPTRTQFLEPLLVRNQRSILKYADGARTTLPPPKIGVPTRENQHLQLPVSGVEIDH